MSKNKRKPKTETRRSPIGRVAVIRTGGEQYLGTVIDAIGDKPKRVRIQSPGRRQGDVVLPREYVLMEWVD